MYYTASGTGRLPEVECLYPLEASVGRVPPDVCPCRTSHVGLASLRVNQEPAFVLRELHVVCVLNDLYDTVVQFRNDHIKLQA